jgi:hypothetical protein
MKLTDDFVMGVPPADSKAGRKYSDGNAMYLCVRGNSKLWRMDSGSGITVLDHA